VLFLFAFPAEIAEAAMFSGRTILILAACASIFMRTQ
jgi:hypothetical protein